MRFNGVMAMVLVHDIDRAVRFYCDLLGFTIQEEQEQWVVFAEGVGLSLSPNPLPDLAVNINAVLVTLLVDDVRAAFEELTEKGVAFLLPPTEEEGALFATFRDTESNLLQLMQIG